MFSRLSASLITLFSLVAVILALPTDVDELHGLKREDTGSICGSEPTPDAVNEMENAFASLLAGNDAVAPDAGSTVPVYFNVISADTTYSGGSVSYVVWQIFLFSFPHHSFQRRPDRSADPGLEL